MLGFIKKAGYKVVEDINRADVAIINTCGFIKDAKEESLDTIFKVASLKKDGNLQSLIVTGCLSQRYEKELKKELPEVDAFLGTSEFRDIVGVIKKLSLKTKDVNIRSRANFLYDHKDPRFMISPSHYAYVKISEGCRNKCSYCIIKDLRGSFRSRNFESIIKEVKNLGNNKHLREVVLIGQDTTLYGMDLYHKSRISELVKKVASFGVAGWIRLLYTHPAHLDNSLMEVMAKEPSVCKYIDLPIQHINDTILKRMNRQTSKKSIISLVNRIRKDIPGVAIRSSLIVGFPGETKGEFKELVDFVQEIRFERLGVFTYSKEEGTPAFGFKNHISEKVKKERFDTIMKLQQEISKENNKKFLGKSLRVLIDEVDEKDHDLFIGRTEFDAPEVDGVVYIKQSSLSRKNLLKIGEFIKVRVVDTLEYDLVAEPI